MRQSDSMISVLAQSAGVVATLGGGVSDVRTRIQHGEDEEIISVFVPGVSAHGLQLEIQDARLLLYHQMEIEVGSNLSVIPRLLFSCDLPHYIDETRIAASEMPKGLRIVLPHNERSNGYRRKITIDSF